LLGICGNRRGAIVTTFIVCYALTSFISGYVGGGFYSRNDGKPMSSFDISIESLIKYWCYNHLYNAAGSFITFPKWDVLVLKQHFLFLLEQLKLML
jgi:hypothetical protein